MMKEWLLKFSEYNKNIMDLIIGKRNTTLKYTHAYSDEDSIHFDTNYLNSLKNEILNHNPFII